MGTESTILLTGGSGIVGWLLARRFAQAGHAVHLLVRKGSRKGLRERVSAFRALDCAAADRMRVFTGDVTQPGLLDDESRARILAECTGVVHCANERRWDKPRDQVFDVNIGGTRALLELAADFAQPVQRFLHVSDLRVVGDHRGVFTEGMALQGQGFGGDYALESRLLAERHVHRARALPTTVLRCAHPVGVEPDASRVADPLTSLWAGRSSLRGRFLPSPYLHVVHGEQLAGLAVAAYADEEVVGCTLHAADPAAPTVNEVGASMGLGPRRSDGAGLPAPWARLDTTVADGLRRRAGLARPSSDDVLTAIRGAHGRV